MEKNSFICSFPLSFYPPVPPPGKVERVRLRRVTLTELQRIHKARKQPVAFLLTMARETEYAKNGKPQRTPTETK